jgi:hypothetical protein
MMRTSFQLVVEMPKVVWVVEVLARLKTVTSSLHQVLLRVPCLSASNGQGQKGLDSKNLVEEQRLHKSDGVQLLP